MDPVTLYSPDGRKYVVDTPAEEINLRAQGYTNEPRSEDGTVADESGPAEAEGQPTDVPDGDARAADAPAPVIDIQHPENYKVEEIEKFASAHPELKQAIADAEKARGDDARKTVVALGS